MAEWMDVMKQFDRMCLYYLRKHKCPMGCPMSGVNISQCRKIAFEYPDSVERTVMSWAAEHPEPVYPTVYEWLVSIGLLGSMWSVSDLNKHIPADTAQKLGIHPVPIVHCDCGATNAEEARKKLGIEPKEG